MPPRTKVPLETVITLYAEGYSGRQIAFHLGLAKSTVFSQMKKLGISRPNLTGKRANGRIIARKPGLPTGSRKYHRRQAAAVLIWECAFCGEQDKLLVHHRDGNPDNGDVSNLQVLCYSHHTQVHAPPQNQNRQVVATCEWCGSAYTVHRYRDPHQGTQPTRFCSGSCRSKYACWQRWKKPLSEWGK